MNKKLMLTVFMLLGAFGCIGLSVTLMVRSFAESSSVFTTTMEALQGAGEFQQHLSLVLMAIGVGILVFVKKYWS